MITNVRYPTNPKTPKTRVRVLNSLLGEGNLEVVELKAPLKRLIVLRFGVDFSERVVAGDEDTGRPELDASTFGLCWEWVVICPLLEVVPTDLLGT